MKRIAVVMFAMLIFASCGESADKLLGGEVVVVSETTTSIPTAITDIKKITETLNIIAIPQSDNIREIDLNLLENSEYLQHNPRKNYWSRESGVIDGYWRSWGEHLISDERVIIEEFANETGYLYLVENSGEKKMLLMVNHEDYPGNTPEIYFWGMIDNERFSYIIVIHESTAGFGIYNLATGEDYRMDGGYRPVKIIDNYLMLENGFISDIRGFGKLNLDNYDFAEVDFPLWEERNGFLYWCGVDFSPDGTKAAIYATAEDNWNNNINEYQVLIYSITEERVLQTYNFFSDNKYVNHSLVYLNENRVFAFAFRVAYSDSQDHLYIIDLH